MQELEVLKSQWTPHLKRRGIITVRGLRVIGRGPLTLKCGSESIVVNVKNVHRVQLYAMSHLEATLEGRPSPGALKEYLKSQYQNVEHADMFTMIQWDKNDSN